MPQALRFRGGIHLARGCAAGSAFPKPGKCGRRTPFVAQIGQMNNLSYHWQMAQLRYTHHFLAGDGEGESQLWQRWRQATFSIDYPEALHRCRNNCVPSASEQPGPQPIRLRILVLADS